MKLTYRPEIDGLRTIAVLSVLFYHAQISIQGHNLFLGGFVGVDVFFVISGYLISRILITEILEKGRINFFQFYERRARRILPILFIVFFSFFPLAYFYLLPHQLIEYSQSILSATFFSSNFFFYLTNIQYGAEDNLLQPFLHTWSLGVEEQFYILFPIVLILSFKYSKKYFLLIIFVLMSISLLYADWESTKNIKLNFYSLLSRFWEMGVGSILAFYELKYGKSKYSFLNHIMPLLGIFLIIYSVIFFNSKTPHPSFLTLLPILGTSLIIFFSINRKDAVGRVLSSKYFQRIGLVSYSIYLWHYPIFAFARIADNNLSNDEKYLLIILVILLANISYSFIEKPFRKAEIISRKFFFIFLTTSFISILISTTVLIKTNGLDYRFQKFTSLENYNWSHEDLRDKSHNYIDHDYDNENLIDYKKVLIIGNSHSKDLDNSLKLNKKLFKTIASSIYQINIVELLDQDNQKQFIESNQFINAQIILISTQYTNGDYEALDSLLPLFQKLGKEIIIFGNNAEFKKIRGNKIALSDIFLMRFDTNQYENISKLKKDMDKFHFQNLKKEKIELNKKLESLAILHNVKFLDKMHLVCDFENKSCNSLDDNFSKTYLDDNHWTIEGATLFGRKLFEKGFYETLVYK